MALISINSLSLGFRGPTLLDNVSCRIERGQRIGLLGRNGAGKTTFMRLLTGQLAPDHGEIKRAPDLRLALLQQDVPLDLRASVRDVVQAGLPRPLSEHADDPELAWRGQHQIEQLLTRMQLDESAAFDTLSSGLKRRVLLAQALVSKPDILLLDEPTNHLDIDAIGWLEDFVLRWDGTCIFVTHDRMFLRRLATRILEIDRGRLFDWSCDYATFLKRKEAALEAEEQQQALFDKKLAQEEAWIRQGIKARRTRNEGRVRALMQLRRDRQQRRSKVGNARIIIQEAQRSGNLVADIKDIEYAYDERPIVSRFSTTIMRGDKIGIIGPNGVGKTTLLQILLGQLQPQAGSVRLGTNLQIAYFDQLRQQLDDEATVQHNVGDGYETIQIDGKPRHVIGYLQDFLFTPERARSPVKFLSGGERNRVLLAKLFAKPANVIVLDEPTNDLDTETLELLEERLVAFPGTVLLVSHDRHFLNEVVTSTIVLADGSAREYVGGYDDWQRQAEAENDVQAADVERAPKPTTTPKAVAAAGAGGRRLKFKEQQELAALPDKIETLEQKIAHVQDQMAQPTFYKQSGEEIARVRSELESLTSQLEAAFERWAELEALNAS